MDQPRTEDTVERERFQILSRLERWMEWPLIGLAFIWLALLIVEFVHGQARWLETLGVVIWIIFIVDFLVRLLVAPRRISYLKSNWLTVLSLIVPALRVFRVFAVLRIMRAARVARGLRLIRVVGSVNRGMGALGRTMRRRGFGYVLLLTVIVTVAGAAGMYAFERDVPSEHGLRSYGSALWWTAMVVTTMGTDYWPQTTEPFALLSSGDLCLCRFRLCDSNNRHVFHRKRCGTQ